MMYADSLLPTLRPLAVRAAEAEGVRVAWLEFKRQGGSWVFRVFIEREEANVGLADCERVAERLGLLLDVEDPIDASYTLEVSTPGLDRPLHDENDYRRFTGRLARLTTRRAQGALGGRRRFTGRLAGVEDGSVLLDEETSGERIRVPLQEIEKGRLEVELDRPEGPAKGRRRR